MADTEDSLGSKDSLTPDGEPLQASPETLARRREIAKTLARVGLLPNDSAEADNPAVDVLAALLPRDANIELCLSCHKFSASQAYPFHEVSCSAPEHFSRGVGLSPGGGSSLAHRPRAV